MPRKAFIADIKTAGERGITGITHVDKGDDDGEVRASYAPVSGTPIELSLLVTPGKIGADFMCEPTEANMYQMLAHIQQRAVL
jgi:hypothetical protein